MRRVESEAADRRNPNRPDQPIEEWLAPDTDEAVSVWRQAIAAAMEFEADSAVEALDRYGAMRKEICKAWNAKFGAVREKSEKLVQARRGKRRIDNLEPGDPSRNDELTWIVYQRKDPSAVVLECPECGASMGFPKTWVFPAQCMKCRKVVVRDEETAQEWIDKQNRPAGHLPKEEQRRENEQLLAEMVGAEVARVALGDCR